MAALRGLVLQCSRSGVDSLPSVAELAARFGVSPTTVWLAVQALCSEGILQTRRGSGTRIVSGNVPEAVAPLLENTASGARTLARWERLSKQITDDFLVRAERLTDSLPDLKFLTAHYGASRETVRRALAVLVDEGRLERLGKGHRIALAAPGTINSSVVLIAPGRSDGSLATRLPNDQESFRWLDRRCAAARLSLHTVVHDAGGRHLFYAGPERVPVSLEELTPLGYLIWQPGNAGAVLERLLRLIPPGSGPVALSAFATHLRAVSAVRTSSLVRGFSPPEYGSAAGIQVGRFVAERGHRRVLCIFPKHDPTGVMQERLDGVVRSIGAVHADARVHIARFDSSERPPLADSRYRERFDAFTDMVGDACAGNGEFTCLVEATRRVASTIREEVRLAHTRDAVDEAYRSVPPSVTPSAIVAWNDEVAAACLQILREEGRRVPDDVSLVSFDDTAVASLGDITSYNFNESQVLFTMLDWVLWPDRRHNRGIASAPRGFVTQRRSVRSRQS